jgi:hypothetical protein
MDERGNLCQVWHIIRRPYKAAALLEMCMPVLAQRADVQGDQALRLGGVDYPLIGESRWGEVSMEG